MIATTLFIHVFFGILSLITGVIIIFLRKGTRWHNNVGWLYFFTMTGVFLSATVVSLYKHNIFLLLIGFFSFYLVHTGIRYRFLREPGSVQWWDKLTTVIYGLIYLVLILYAVYAFLKGANGLGVVLSSFGLIGVLLWKNDYFYILRNQRKFPEIWFNEHIGRMMGSFIAAVTAFAVNNISFEPAYIVWIAPTVPGFLLMFYFSKKYIKT